MKVEELLSELDHEVWARVEPETRKTGLMVWSADWHCNAYLPRGLGKYRSWEVADVYVEVGKDPETGEPTAILVIPAVKSERRQRCQTA
jgi:hypothetical protein